MACSSQGGAFSGTLHADTCWHHDATGWTQVCLGWMAEALGPLYFRHTTLKMELPGTAEEGREATRAMQANCCPAVLSGLTKDTLKTQKHKQGKINTVKNKKRVREASSLIHSPWAAGDCQVGRTHFSSEIVSAEIVQNLTTSWQSNTIHALRSSNHIISRWKETLAGLLNRGSPKGSVDRTEFQCNWFSL